jgi:hypothetical protein
VHQLISFFVRDKVPVHLSDQGYSAAEETPTKLLQHISHSSPSCFFGGRTPEGKRKEKEKKRKLIDDWLHISEAYCRFVTH